MAEDLGEVKVRIEEEGDAAGEGDDGIGGGGGEGGAGAGGIGGLLGGISAKLAGILGFVAFLASLKPIQELLGGLQRLFSVAILPLVALLNAFLRPILQKLLRFIGGLDFDNLVESFKTQLDSALTSFLSDLNIFDEGEAKSTADTIITGLFGDEETRSIFGGTGGTLQNPNKQSFFRSEILDLEPNEPAFNVPFLEQSPTSLKEGAAQSTTEQNQRNKPGSE